MLLVTTVISADDDAVAAPAIADAIGGDIALLSSPLVAVSVEVLMLLLTLADSLVGAQLTKHGHLPVRRFGGADSYMHLWRSSRSIHPWLLMLFIDNIADAVHSLRDLI